MISKISNFVFLSSLILLQSCSGGRLGNFLESSFKNNDFSNQILKKENSQDRISKNKISSKKEILVKNENYNVDNFTNKSREDNNSKKEKIYLNKVKNTSNDQKNNNEKSINNNKNFDPKSYRVFVILKEVDPSSPSENFSKVLRNANIDFEIEKIELIPDLKKLLIK